MDCVAHEGVFSIAPKARGAAQGVGRICKSPFLMLRPLIMRTTYKKPLLASKTKTNRDIIMGNGLLWKAQIYHNTVFPENVVNKLIDHVNKPC